MSFQKFITKLNSLLQEADALIDECKNIDVSTQVEVAMSGVMGRDAYDRRFDMLEKRLQALQGSATLFNVVNMIRFVMYNDILASCPWGSCLEIG